ESNDGDVCEIDVAGGEIRDLTKGLGAYHSFLRVLVLSNADYLLVGPQRVFGGGSTHSASGVHSRSLAYTVVIAW
ncbi:MAG: hypothetical protein KDE31_07265, partial [Caldilineaceae bacterium]|nr:hypothetical protein [Caldilineaceae bacterium]